MERTLCIEVFIQKNMKKKLPVYNCCFHPILVTWFLVVFGKKVTKLLRNSFFVFHFVLPVLPCKQNTSYKKHETKVTKKPKTKLSKYGMSRANILKYSNESPSPLSGTMWQFILTTKILK